MTPWWGVPLFIQGFDRKYKYFEALVGPPDHSAFSRGVSVYTLKCFGWSIDDRAFNVLLPPG
jgi:hypothetical protein